MDGMGHEYSWTIMYVLSCTICNFKVEGWEDDGKSSFEKLIVLRQIIEVPWIGDVET